MITNLEELLRSEQEKRQFTVTFPTDPPTYATLHVPCNAYDVAQFLSYIEQRMAAIGCPFLGQEKALLMADVKMFLIRNGVTK